ncbi:MAG: hypothetical protein ABSG21_06850 [Spirochaetia bacterium]|jgi:hypothetical protein
MIAGISRADSAGAHVGEVLMTALRYAQPDAGDVVVSVRPAQLISANFKHIQVRPDSRLEDGVPLYKLKILDTLIDHLSLKNPVPRFDSSSIDSMIVEMSNGFRAPRGSGQSYRTGFLPAPGAFVDLVA